MSVKGYTAVGDIFHMVPHSLSFKTRILGLVLSLVILAVWALAVRLAAILESDLGKLTSDQLSAQVRYVANELDQELSFRIESLAEIASGIELDQRSSPGQIQRLLERSRPSGTLFRLGVLIVNRDGVIVADHAANPVARRYRSVGEEGHFGDVIGADSARFGAPILAKRFSNEPVIPLAVPLHDNSGTVTGTLVAPINSSDPDLFGKLIEAKIGRTGSFRVFSPADGVVVFANNGARIMQPLTPRGTNSELDRYLYEGFEGPAIGVNSAGIPVLGVSHKMETTGWIVIAGISTEEAFAPINSFKKQIYLSAAVISLALAVLLILVLRRQMAPLEDANRAMQLMSQGKTPFEPIPVRRRDEIGNLVESFNGLVRDRKRAEREIRDLNRSLEARVQERTDELSLANRRLEEEILERKRIEVSVLEYAERMQLVSRRIVDVQEGEQRRLARELHDRVSSNLSAIRLSLELLEKQLSPEFMATWGNRLSDCLDVIAETMATARDITSDLHPPILEYLGLTPALEALGEQFELRTDIAVTVVGPHEGIRLPPEKEIALFRIAQEALTNCSKHSAAKCVDIRLSRDANVVTLSIVDDGVGFDATKMGSAEKSFGLGLLSMTERAQAVGGTCLIEAMPGIGTKVTVEVHA